MDAETLRSVPLFAELEDEALALIAGLARPAEAPAGQTLIEPRMAGSGLIVLTGGTAEVETRGRTFELGRGEFLGELALLTGEARSARVRAQTDVSFFAIAREDFLALLEAEPRIAVAMLTCLARRFADRTGA